MTDPGSTGWPDSLALVSEEQLDRAVADSAASPLVLLKHSTRGEISSRALGEFLRFVREAVPHRARAALVLVIENRAVSNAVARRLGVPHESPQALLVRAGRAVWHASHGEVTADRLREALDAAD